jgi:hypothetical protein
MAFVLEGKSQDELPEKLLGGVRMINVDLKQWGRNWNK